MTVFGPFFGPWMAISCQKRETRFWYFPKCFLCFFNFLTTLWPWFEPVLFSIFIDFLIFLLQIKHNTAHNIHNTQPHTRTHTHTHAHLPLTVILRVVWVRVTRGKTLKNVWKRQSQGNLWRMLVSISKGKSFVFGKVAKDESNHLVAGSLWSCPHSQEKTHD